MIFASKTLIAAVAFAASTSAFTVPSQLVVRSAALRSVTPSAQDIELTRRVIVDHLDKQIDNAWIDDSDDVSKRYDSLATSQDTRAPEKLILDIPPPPSVSLVQSSTSTSTLESRPYTLVNTRKSKPFNPAHKEGLLSPLVYAANSILGKEELNKLRAQVISLHSDIIKSFVDTADSELGKAVLRQLFDITDRDNSGYLDREEVAKALELLGFKWLEEKHVAKIFERADLNADGEISLEEFMREAPQTLRVNLVKLAKKNGGELGLLV